MILIQIIIVYSCMCYGKLIIAMTAKIYKMIENGNCSAALLKVRRNIIGCNS